MPDDIPNYDAAIAELNELVAQLDNGTLPLQETLEHYQRAEILIRYCRLVLEGAEAHLETSPKELPEQQSSEDLLRRAG